MFWIVFEYLSFQLISIIEYMEKLTTLQLNNSILYAKRYVPQYTDEIHLDVLFRVMIEIYRYCHFDWLYLQIVDIDLRGTALFFFLFRQIHQSDWFPIFLYLLISPWLSCMFQHFLHLLFLIFQSCSKRILVINMIEMFLGAEQL